MTTTYEHERAKGLRYVRRQCDAWRREMGLPPRIQEEMHEAAVRIAKVFENLRATERYAHPARFIAGTVNPGAPDGFNNWEDGMRDRLWQIPDESPCIYVDCSDEPTPIFRKLLTERGGFQ